jgi:hypothetical protein
MTFKKVIKWLWLPCLCFAFACGSSSSTSSTSSSSSDISDSSQAAVGSVFSVSGTASLSAGLDVKSQIMSSFVKTAVAQSSDNTCDTISSAPTEVNAVDTGTAGTHGSASDQVTVTSSDFCNGLTGSSNSSDDLFASFTISSEAVSCDSSAITIDGEGVWRNRPSEGFLPAIYGSFTLTDSTGAAITYDCSIYLDDGETVHSDSSCTDSTGKDVSPSNVTSCSGT